MAPLVSGEAENVDELVTPAFLMSLNALLVHGEAGNVDESFEAGNVYDYESNVTH